MKGDNLTLGQLSMWTFMIYYYFHEKNNVFFSYECRWAWWFHCCVAAATLASWAWTLAESLWHLPTKILLLADIVGFRKTTFWAKALMEFHISMFSYCTNTKKKWTICVFIKKKFKKLNWNIKQPNILCFGLKTTFTIICANSWISLCLWADPLLPCKSSRSDLQDLQTFMGIDVDWEKND